jgi:RNA polymerase sigma factor (sigma-70 family)
MAESGSLNPQPAQGASGAQASGKRSGVKHHQALRLLLSHRPLLLAYLVTFVRDFNKAEELYRDVCVIACESWKDFPAGADFGVWVREIARRRALADLKEGTGGLLPPPEVLVDEIDKTFNAMVKTPVNPALGKKDSVRMTATAVSPLEEAWRKNKDALRRCLKNLPVNARQWMDLRYVQDLNAQKIAARLGMDTQTVTTALNRTRRELEVDLQRKLAEPPPPPELQPGAVGGGA